MEKVVLVDANDREIGVMEKLEAHRKGLLHRAFSILLFNSDGQLLLQKRSNTKYHSGGLWTNTCCSHPRPDEDIQAAVERRLHEEMGISAFPEFLYSFTYRAELDTDLIEHELDYVFTGIYDDEPVVNPDEVADWKFVKVADILSDIQHNPDAYTAWFRLIMNSFSDRLK